MRFLLFTYTRLKLSVKVATMNSKNLNDRSQKDLKLFFKTKYCLMQVKVFHNALWGLFAILLTFI